MYMLLALATAVYDPAADRPPTSLISTTLMVVVAAILALLIVATALSGVIASLAVIAATAFRALFAELCGLIIILLALLLVLALMLSGRDHTSRPPHVHLTAGELIGSAVRDAAVHRREVGEGRGESTEQQGYVNTPPL
jgi:membrane protein implicated in regulation of membrane protease activity